jgi:photosystem II stability/assembly factor-like uncharacterized protein
MKRIICFTALLLIAVGNINAQSIKMLHSGMDLSCRGLSVWDDSTFWVSGNKGMVGVSYNDGNTMEWKKVNGYENREFRDIHMFSPAEVIIMAIDNPAVMLKSLDSGKTWNKVFELDKAGIFLDAMDFKNELGYCIGDPLDGQFFILKTIDKGNTWQQITNAPIADSGEACFASSGSNIIVTDYGFAFISGGLHSYAYKYNQGQFNKASIDFTTGSATSGGNAIVERNKNLIVVGGDFSKPQEDNNTFFTIYKGGKDWASKKIYGYKSCIEKYGKNNWISCGTSGVAICDNYFNWRTISELKFHVVKKAMHGHAVYLAGSNGNIAKLLPK